MEIRPGEEPIEQTLKISGVNKNMACGSYVVKTDSHIPESYFEEARF